MVEQEATTQGTIMFRGVELVFVIKQETVVLPRAKPIVAKGVHVVVKIKYNECKFNQLSGSIIKKVPRD